MSARPRRPAGDSPLARWLAELTLARAAERFSPGEIEIGLAHRFVHAEPPRVERDMIVGAFAPDPRKGRRSRSRVHQVRLQPYGGYVGATCSTCIYTYGRLCPHTLALLADLAVSPELREALVRGEPTAPALERIEAARAEARASVKAARIAGAWIPVPQRAVGEIEVSLTVHDGRTPVDVTSASAYLGYPALEIRFRPSGERTLLGADELARTVLAPEVRRVVSACTPLSRNRKGLGAAGIEASLALELLRHLPVKLEGDRRPVHFGTATAHLSIVRASLPARFVEPAGAAPRGLPARASSSRQPWNNDAPGDDVDDVDAVDEPPDAVVDALEARWATEDGAIDLPARETAFFSGPYPFLWVPRTATFYPVDRSIDVDVAWLLHRRPAIELVEGHAASIYRAVRAGLRGRRVPVPPPEAMGLSPAERPAISLRIEGSPFDVRATLEARYSAATFQLGAGPAEARAGEDALARSEEVEAAAVARVLSAGLAYDPEARSFRASEDAAVGFWSEGLPRLRGADEPAIELLVPADLARTTVRGPIRSRVRIDAAGGWFEASVAFEADEVAAEADALREALRRKRRWVVLRDGSIAQLAGPALELVEEAAEVLDVLDAGGHARLPPHQLGLVERWVEVAPDAEIAPAFAELSRRLKSLSVEEAAALPAGLEATLRPYQSQGLAWLQFLVELGAGGILADDMGLGKTLMTLAFLAWRREREGRAPALVVCPTSVAGNWIREASRFTPGLRTLLLSGPGRAARLPEIAESDLVVTTYALLRRDVDALEATEFRAVVLDEAQNIKNAGAATRHAAGRLRGAQRLALTGTPVENRLGELWSILDFCNPGMLGSERSFQERFERRIVADPRGPAAAALRARVRPFLLRRTKRQVLAELPPKEEIDLPCVPDASQRRLYDALAALLRDDVGRKIRDEGLARSGLAVLTALLRLRQMCLDPRLVDPRRTSARSAKREAFLDLVRGLVAEGRRALVFSQFVELLTLWRRDLDREGIAYEYLDGSTKDRDAVVARFQGGDAPLFLISLKAGGAGLNLTAADTVIHCDPWWNPAVEDQATDRAHRIGQSRSVTVYRLVLRGSIEEKIALLKAKKRELADAVVRDDAGALRGLTEDDVRALLSGVEAEVADDAEEEPPSAPASVPTPAPVTASVPAPASPGRLSGDALYDLRAEVKQWLERTGTKQSELAREVGASQTMMSRFMNGYLLTMPAELGAKLRAVMNNH